MPWPAVMSRNQLDSDSIRLGCNDPVLQDERFDPHGAYVRRFVPELREVPGRFVHRS